MRRACAVLLLAGLVGACSSGGDRGVTSNTAVVSPPGGAGLQPVALPDFSTMESSAQSQMRTQVSALRSKVSDRSASSADLAAAYGETGKLFMAATDLDAAETCFLNAQTLAPSDGRWPYYLGQLYKAKGPLEKSVAAFERSLQLQPSDPATLVYLGDAYLAQGRADAAAPLFSRALSIDATSAAALSGSGRTALAVKDYAKAVKDLEQALARDPQASAVHYPLAMAYRGLGNLREAEAHLAKQGNVEARPVDPLMRQIDGLLQTAEAFNVRGGAALDARNWPVAVENFRKGLEISPKDTSLRHRLGTALYQMGNAAGAAEQFEQVLRIDPRHARAHFSLGVLYAESRRYPEAVNEFRSALETEPGYVPARVQMASALARSGRVQDALGEYEKAVQADPTSVDASYGYAMTLVRLRRYADARDRLAAEMTAHPNEPKVANALARILAAAPDDKVRNGLKAKAIVDELLKGGLVIDVVETAAMMLAEIGRFSDAAAAQRNVVTAAEQQGLNDVVPRLTQNLQRYERGEPCRVPFADTEFP